ncbi:RimK family alpha-L-glutamate ligase [Brevundimonas sp.]|uniref:ATP-grasp domain-containing protein n=1 Tax=Brevundimonas sp. TaxID=1871086 RepID=UPI003562DC87
MDTLYGLHNHGGASLLIDDLPSTRGGTCNANLRAAWYRRHYKVRSAASDADDENGVFRTSESNMMQENVVATLGADPNISWINDPSSARAAEHKFLQLVHAKQSGLAVPPTLMSADPDRIREFARAHRSLVVKPFGVYSWAYSDLSRTYALASKVDAARILDSPDGALSNTPAIYQVAVDKVSDLRVVVVGSDVYAYDIAQVGVPDFDCRFAMANPKMASIEPYSLSAEQKARVLRMMTSLNIDMASADFALTADGDIVFLDLNPAGAWLFLEERVPSVGLTSLVCRLLAEKAGYAPGLDFPDYAAFARSSAVEAFNHRYRTEAEKGATIRNDRTWTEAA